MGSRLQDTSSEIAEEENGGKPLKVDLMENVLRFSSSFVKNNFSFSY